MCHTPLVLQPQWQDTDCRGSSQGLAAVKYFDPACVGVGSWVCKNPFAPCSDARLIQTQCLSRMKESPLPRVRFFCCARGRLLAAFSHQPRSSANMAAL